MDSVAEIFSHFLVRPNDTVEDINRRQAYATFFVINFPKTEFKREERILWHLVNFSVKLETPIKRRFIEVFIETQLRTLLFKERIKIKSTEKYRFEESIDAETIYNTTKDVLLDIYEELLDNSNDLGDFTVDITTWMSNRVSERIIDVYNKGAEIIDATSGKRIGGYDALEYTQDLLSEIADVYDLEKLEDIEDTTDNEDVNNWEEIEAVTDCGLAPIDEDMKCLRRGELLGIEAPPGKGKTRFATGAWVYRTLVKYKKNVLYYALEQKEREIRAMLIARHIKKLWPKKRVDMRIIYTGDYKQSEELVKLVNIASDDLFKSGKYGKIKIVDNDHTMYLETMIQDMKQKDKLHGPFDLIVVDYMTLIEQKGGKFEKNLQDYQITKFAYRKFKKYLSRSGKAGIGINQRNAKGVEDAEKGRKASATGGAGGMEVYRSTDYNIVVSCTDAQEMQGFRQMSCPKARSSKGIDDFICSTYLECCYWYMSSKTNILTSDVA